MSKAVDRTQRCREIAEALLRLVAREGLETASIRTIAAEAGVSAGAVQKYFPTKEDIFELAFELTGERMERRRSALDPGEDYVGLLHRLLLESLPLDDERRAEMIVILAFTARAAVHPADIAFLRNSYDEVLTTATGFLAAAQETGQVRTDLPAERLAEMVVALTDGFATHLLHLAGDRAARDGVLATVRLALTELLAPRTTDPAISAANTPTSGANTPSPEANTPATGGAW